MRKNVMYLLGILIFTSTLLLQGCVTLGAQYQQLEVTPDDKAIVYIYRPSRFVGGGVSYNVYADKKIINTLYNGGYYPYILEPGKVEIWAKTESKSSVEFVAKAGRNYYVKGWVGMGLIVGRPHLEIVSPDLALKEIKECKLIPEYKKPKKEIEESDD